MCGVVRVEHDKSNDQLHLLGSDRYNRRLPSFERSVERLQEVIAAVSSDTEDVVLGFCFSNLAVNECFPGSSRSTARTRMVYPLYDQEVSYTLAKGPFFASQNGDLITVLHSPGNPSFHSSMVLLAKNPFLDETYRPSPLNVLLQEEVLLRPKNWCAPTY